MFKKLIGIGLVVLIVLGAGLALTAASGGRSQGQPAAAATSDPAVAGGHAGDRLILRASQLFTLDAASGDVEHQLPQGVLAPDRSVVYDAVLRGTSVGGQAGWKTMVRAVDTRTGRVVRQMSLDGKYILPWVDSSAMGGLSPDGRWLVLQAEPDEASSSAPADRTQFVVLDTAFERAAKQVLLGGVFSFDSIDNNATALFLIEYLPEQKSGEVAPYRVRFYDLNAGRLDPTIIADKRNAEQVMTGERYRSVASSDGQWLYSLYLNDTHGPFIHVLNLQQRFALCIDLPESAKQDRPAQAFWSLVPAPAGRTLYAANGALGLVATVDTVDLKVERVVQLPAPKAKKRGLPALANWLLPPVEAKELPVGGAAVSPDGRTLWLAGRQGLLAIDTGSLTLRGSYVPDRSLAGLAFSPDGGRLYAISLDRGQINNLAHLVQIDPADGKVVAELAVVQSFTAILSVESPGTLRP